jgi:hypothetical protein
VWPRRQRCNQKSDDWAEWLLTPPDHLGLPASRSALAPRLACVRLSAQSPAPRSRCGRRLASRLAGVALALGAQLNAGLPPARSRRTHAALLLRHSALDRTPARSSACRHRARPSARLRSRLSACPRAPRSRCGSRRSTGSWPASRLDCVALVLRHSPSCLNAGSPRARRRRACTRRSTAALRSSAVRCALSASSSTAQLFASLRPRSPRRGSRAAARAPPPLDASPLTLPPQRCMVTLTSLCLVRSSACSQQPRFAAAAHAASRLAPQLAPPPPLDASPLSTSPPLGTSRSTGCGVAAPAPNFKAGFCLSRRARVALALRCEGTRRSTGSWPASRRSRSAHVPARVALVRRHSARDCTPARLARACAVSPTTWTQVVRRAAARCAAPCTAAGQHAAALSAAARRVATRAAAARAAAARAAVARRAAGRAAAASRRRLARRSRSLGRRHLTRRSSRLVALVRRHSARGVALVRRHSARD